MGVDGRTSLGRRSKGSLTALLLLVAAGSSDAVTLKVYSPGTLKDLQGPFFDRANGSHSLSMWTRVTVHYGGSTPAELMTAQDEARTGRLSWVATSRVIDLQTTVEYPSARQKVGECDASEEINRTTRARCDWEGFTLRCYDTSSEPPRLIYEYPNTLLPNVTYVPGRENHYLWYCSAESGPMRVENLPAHGLKPEAKTEFTASAGTSTFTLNLVSNLLEVGWSYSPPTPSGVFAFTALWPNMDVQCPDWGWLEEPNSATGYCERDPDNPSETPPCPEPLIKWDDDTCRCPQDGYFQVLEDDGSVACIDLQELKTRFNISSELEDGLVPFSLTRWHSNRERWETERAVCFLIAQDSTFDFSFWRRAVDSGEWEEVPGRLLIGQNRVLACYRQREWWPADEGGDDRGRHKRALVSNGLSWYRTSEDPSPTDPILDPPPVDFLDVFGPCHSVDGLPVTPCFEEPRTDLPANLRVAGATAGEASPGDPLELEVAVQNTGGATAPNTEYKVTWTAPDGSVRSQRGWVGSLMAGATRALQIRSDVNSPTPFLAEVGTYRTVFEADHLQDLAEGDELDNLVTLTLVAEPSASVGVDLRATPVSFDLANPAEGQTVTARFGVENVGTLPAPASTSRITATAPGGDQEVFETSVPALASGGRWTGSVEITPSAPGILAVSSAADAHGQLAEVDEYNNGRHRTLSVHPAGGCTACTSGSPSHVGALLCFDPGDGGPPQAGSAWECLGVRPDGTTCAASGDHPNGWAPAGSRCADPQTLCRGTLHGDRCGNPGICPGSAPCD